MTRGAWHVQTPHCRRRSSTSPGGAWLPQAPTGGTLPPQCRGDRGRCGAPPGTAWPPGAPAGGARGARGCRLRPPPSAARSPPPTSPAAAGAHASIAARRRASWAMHGRLCPARFVPASACAPGQGQREAQMRAQRQRQRWPSQSLHASGGVACGCATHMRRCAPMPACARAPN